MIMRVIKHSAGTTIDIQMSGKWFIVAHRFVFHKRVYPMLRTIGLHPGRMLMYRAFVLRLGRTHFCIGQKA